MDWAQVTQELQRAAKLYKVFEAGAEAAQEMVNAEHRAANLKKEGDAAQAVLEITQAELQRLESGISAIRPQHEDMARTLHTLKIDEDQTRLRLDKLRQAADELDKRMVSDRTQAQENVNTLLAKRREQEAEFHRVALEVKKLQAIRDTLKASLAQV